MEAHHCPTIVLLLGVTLSLCGILGRTPLVSLAYNRCENRVLAKAFTVLGLTLVVVSRL